MNRLFTKNATGIATDGRWYPGDINAIQDAVAAITDLAQALSVGSIAIGESGLQVLRYGPGEARLTGAMRTDGVVRALGGFYAGAFTTAARNAILAGQTPQQRPFGLVILNTDNSRFEWNAGTDAAPNWLPIAATTTTGTVSQGTNGSRPTAPVSGPNTWYFSTDVNGGTLAYSNGTIWTPVAKGLTEAPQAHAASHHPQTGSDRITMSLASTAALRPAASAVVAGTFHWATDTLALSRSDGVSTWTPIVSGGVATHASTHLSGGSDPIAWQTIHPLGTFGGRPSPTNSLLGYLYFAQDTNVIYECVTGPAWVVALTTAPLPYQFAESTAPANTGGGNGVWLEYASGANCTMNVAVTGTYSVRFGARGTGNAGATGSFTGVGIGGSVTAYSVEYGNTDAGNSARETVMALTAGQRIHLMHMDNDSGRPISSVDRFLMIQKIA